MPASQDPDWSPHVLRYLSQWQVNMSAALAPLMDPASPHGVFNPACFLHTGFSAHAPLIANHSYLEAFGEWYFRGTPVKLQDRCGLLCNPTCAHSGSHPASTGAAAAPSEAAALLSLAGGEPRTDPEPPMPHLACRPRLLGRSMKAAGHDLAQSRRANTSEACAAACCADGRCAGALFEPASAISWHGCVKGEPCCFLKTSVADAQPLPAPSPGFQSELWKMDGRSQDPETLGFLAAALGSHMVLQRAPLAATVWGFTAPGATVTSTIAPARPEECEAVPALASGGACATRTLTCKAGADGAWRQALPPVAASTVAFSLTFASSNSSAERAELHNVLFGDVYLCGGQSNMEFAMPADANASAEIAAADAYPHIRIFSVGHRTSSATPLRDLQTVWEPWQVASRATIAKDFTPHSHLFATFSAVCWHFGKSLSDRLAARGSVVPLGLVSNNWGGTKLEMWAPATVFDECGVSPPPQPLGGPMWNAMILPYAAGPMALSGFVWYQGEADTATTATAALYRCTFPKMIGAWRDAFRQPTAFFGFVQLSTWCGGGELAEALPAMRDAQMGAAALHGVAYATNADHGMGCAIHPAFKRPVAERLATAALAVRYNESVRWRSPRYVTAEQTTPQAEGTVTVEISLRDVSPAGLHLRRPFNYFSPGYAAAAPVAVDCTGSTPVSPTANVSMALMCAWASLLVDGVGWLNASAEATAGGRTLLLSAVLPVRTSSAARVLATSYGYGPIPMLSAYDAGTNLPVLPWNTTLQRAAPAATWAQPPYAPATTATQPPYDTRFFEQRVDHASPAANATWRQRYLISEAHWGGPGSPILFYTGNEGPITGFWAACGFVTEVLAPRLGALVVFAEQRFYGESLPFGRIGSFSPAALALLTAEQVLADYALLLTSLKAQLHAAESRVVAFGGSFGGTLATLFRAKYPHVVVGALAASAPLGYYSPTYWKERGVDELTWFRTVERVYTEAKEGCYETLVRAVHLANATARSDGRAAAAAFGLCSPPEDADAFVFWVTEALESMPQIDYQDAGSPVNATCEAVRRELQGAELLAALAAVTRRYYGVATDACLPQTSARNLQVAGGTPGDGPAPASSWGYQSCSETLHPFSIPPGSWRPYRFSLPALTALCRQYYNVTPDLHRLERWSGGYAIAGKDSGHSNIIWSNGRRDPWHGGGFLRAADALPGGAVFVMDSTAHHQDLRLPQTTDPPELTSVRAMEERIIRGWLRESGVGGGVGGPSPNTVHSSVS